MSKLAKFFRGFIAVIAVAALAPALEPAIGAIITGDGGGGTPGGSNTQVQFNDSGAFGGDAGLVYNKTTDALTTTGLLTVNQGTANTVAAGISNSVTGSSATTTLSITPSWNTSGSPTAIDVNVSRTATSYFAKLLDLRMNNTSYFTVGENGNALATRFQVAGGGVFGDSNGYGVNAPASYTIGWAPSVNEQVAPDTYLNRIAAGIVGVRGASGIGAAISQIEQTAPSAPSTNGVYIYAEDNGSGKTRLMARFATGAAQQLAIEP